MNTKTAVTAWLLGGAPLPRHTGNASRQSPGTGAVGSGGVGGVGSVAGSASASAIGNRVGRDPVRRRVRPAPPSGRAHS